MADQAASSSKEMSKEEMEQQFEEVRRKTRPKGVGEGVASGLKTAAAGIAAGVAGLVAAPVVGAKEEGVTGFAKGMVAGVVGAVVLPVTGIVGGAVQVGRGVVNEAEAVEAKKAGKVWNKETREWEAPPGNEIAPYDADAQAQRTRLRGDPAEVDYYEVLEVAADADAATIKRQYYLLARKYHPDKCKDDPAATQRFQQLGEAYQVLSNVELRERYDKHGRRGVDVDFVDASAVFGMLFGSEMFEPLVGEFIIAAAASRGADITEAEVNRMQEVRISKLLVELKKRLAPYLSGEEDGFREVQACNAETLAAASFGEVMLHTIGRVYESEAEIARSNVISSHFEKFKRFNTNMKSQIAAAKAAVNLAQHQAKIEALDKALAGEDVKALQEKAASGDPQAQMQLYGFMQQRAAMEKHGMSLALGAMWAANVVDIQRTLHSVCKRLLREPNISKEEFKKRAQGLAELGRIFLEARAPPALRKDTEVQVDEALKKLQEMYMGTASEEPEDKTEK